MYLILETSETHDWPPIEGIGRGALRIPANRQPTVLQAIDETKVELELLRLHQQHPGKRFVAFKAVSMAVTVKMPTHVDIGGNPFRFQEVGRVAKIDEDDELPF